MESGQHSQTNDTLEKNVQIYTCIRFRDGDQSEDQEPVNQT